MKSYILIRTRKNDPSNTDICFDGETHSRVTPQSLSKVRKNKKFMDSAFPENDYSIYKIHKYKE
jgi:hypothetical protein